MATRKQKITKEDFLKMTTEEKIDLLSTNPDIYEQLELTLEEIEQLAVQSFYELQQNTDDSTAFYQNEKYIRTAITPASIENPMVVNFHRNVNATTLMMLRSVDKNIKSIADYRDKYISKTEDLMYLSAITAVPVLAWGQVDKGKTSIANKIAETLTALGISDKVIRVDSSATIDEFIGITSLEKREDGRKVAKTAIAPFTNAMLESNSPVIIYDEYTRSKPDVHNVLNGFLSNGIIKDVEVYKKDNGEYRPFRMIATSNYLDSDGVKELSTNILTRFAHIEVGKDAEEKYSIRRQKFAGVISSLTKAWSGFKYGYIPSVSFADAETIINRYNAILRVIDQTRTEMSKRGYVPVNVNALANRYFEKQQEIGMDDETNTNKKRIEERYIAGFPESYGRLAPRIALLFAYVDTIPENLMSSKRKAEVKLEALISAFGEDFTNNLLNVSDLVNAAERKEEILRDPIKAGISFNNGLEGKDKNYLLEYLSGMQLITSGIAVKELENDKEVIKKLVQFAVVPTILGKLTSDTLASALRELRDINPEYENIIKRHISDISTSIGTDKDFILNKIFEIAPEYKEKIDIKTTKDKLNKLKENLFINR